MVIKWWCLAVLERVGPRINDRSDAVLPLSIVVCREQLPFDIELQLFDHFVMQPITGDL